MTDPPRSGTVLLMTTTTLRTPFELRGGDVLVATGDYVLSVSWGKSRKRAVVLEIQRPDATTGRRYFADDATAIEVTR